MDRPRAQERLVHFRRQAIPRPQRQCGNDGGAIGRCDAVDQLSFPGFSKTIYAAKECLNPVFSNPLEGADGYLAPDSLSG